MGVIGRTVDRARSAQPAVLVLLLFWACILSGCDHTEPAHPDELEILIGGQGPSLSARLQALKEQPAAQQAR